MGASKVQRTSCSAMSWLSRHGGQVQNPRDDLVAQLSTVGCEGRYPANAERDIHRKLRHMSRSVQANIRLKKVRLTNPSTGEVSYQDFPLLLPDDLCKALWKCGEHVFRTCLFGKMTEAETEAYWKHIEQVYPWFGLHPANSWYCKSKLASITAYGDEVQCYKNSECGVISVTAWSSELGWKNDPLLRYFPIAIWSEHHECEYTYDDVMKHVVESFRKLTSPTQMWPWTSQGYLVAFTGVQGDLKWICDRMNGMHNFRKNEFCSRCECVKNHDDPYRTLPHFASDEGHHRPRDYSNANLGELFSPLLSIPGMVVERVMHDIMHSQYLGSGKTLNGGV